MKRKHGKKDRSTAPDPSGDGYGYLRRRGLSREEIARGHNQGVGHNSGMRADDDDDDEKADRPSLGTGMAEKAARRIENRRSAIDKQIDKAMGRNDDDEDD